MSAKRDNGALRHIDVSLDRKSNIPLHRQLRRHFTRLIANHEIDNGEFLPSTRAIAESLGINRLTALRAFQAMQRAGTVRAHRGRGYYVARPGDSDLALGRPRDLFGARATYQARPEHAFSDTVRSATDMPLSFAVGYPDIAMLPSKQIRRMFARWSDQFGGRDLAYQSPAGHSQLRLQLWHYLEARGIAQTPDRELLVTNGAQHALDIFARAFPRKTGFVAMESPAYYGALAVVRVNGYTGLPIVQDESGLSTAALAGLCQSRSFDFLYVNPTYNNPTGTTMPRDRRESVVALAHAHDFVILEDDTYADLGFAGTRPTTLMALDAHNRTCHIGSFSKSFIPGLRMGYIVGPKNLIARMIDIHGVNEMCSATLSQLVLYDALASGFYDRHVRRMRKIYAQRCAVMKDALTRELTNGCRFAAPKGGFFYWVRLPERIDCRELQRRCNIAGVDIALGPEFFTEGYGGNYIRLNFTLLDEDKIRLGVKLMAEQIRDLLGSGRVP
jgi:GntR family transcriptional regulator of abcA and norABC